MQFHWIKVTILLTIATGCLGVEDPDLSGSFQEVADKVSELQDEVIRQMNDVVGDQTVLEQLKATGVYVIELLNNAIVELHIHFHFFDSCAEGFNNLLAQGRDYLIATIASLRYM